jgi:adenylate cyclase
VIHRRGGVVDKYMGDAILAVFGLSDAAATSPGNASARAIAAAVEMMAAIEAHNVVRAASGKPPFAHGIGVHHGRVIAGHVGTPERLQYTVIGDAVNVAARLQTATKEVGVPVLVSDDVARIAEPKVPLTALPPLSLRGRAAPIAVHTPP